LLCGKFAQIEDPDHLWRLLLKITRNKFLEKTSISGKEQNQGDLAEWIPGRGSAPDVIVQGKIEFNRLLDLLPADLRRIALLKLDGFTNREIAREVNRAPVTVSRKLSRIRRIWMEKGVQP